MYDPLIRPSFLHAFGPSAHVTRSHSAHTVGSDPGCRDLPVAAQGGPNAAWSARARALAARTARAAAVPLLVLAAPVGAQQADPYVILEEASERFASIETLCSDFHQVLDVPLLGERREGDGRLCQRRPDLFSMRFQDPSGDLVVVDGEHAWVYTPSRDPEQVLRAPMTAVGGRLDFHGEFLEAPRTKYDAVLQGSDTVAGMATRRILLRPREPARYRDALVWIGEDRFLRQVEVREENGSIRTVTLTDFEVDGAVPEGTFSFTPPPGTRVVAR